MTEAWEQGPPEGLFDDERPQTNGVSEAPKFDPADPLALTPKLQAVAIVGSVDIHRIAARPVPYVWTDIATAAQIVALNGKPGGGKTTLLFLILVGRANDLEPINLLGRELKPAGAEKWIVIVEGEQSEGSACRKLVRSVEALGVDDEALDRVILLARKDVLLGNERWLEVEKLVRLGAVSDVGIDSLARVAAGESNSEEEQARIFGAFQALIEAAPGDEKSKPIIWLVTHARKSADGTSVDDMSGSAQRAAQIDTMINVEPVKDAGRTIASKCYFPKLREDPDNYPTPVEFSVAKDPSGRWRVTYGEVTDGAPHERIHAMLSDQGELTKSRIREALGLSTDTFEDAITRLFREHRVTKVQKPIAGRMRWVFKATAPKGTEPDERPRSSDA